MTSCKLKRTVFYTLNITVPLVAGFYIYLVFRPDSYIVKAVQPLGIGFRNNYPDFHPFFRFIRNFIPDILWAYSMSFAVFAVLAPPESRTAVPAAICICFGILVEFFQKIGLFHGTFDLLDILFEAAAILLSTLIIKKERRIYNEKSS